jgi:hypothetical protein
MNAPNARAPLWSRKRRNAPDRRAGGFYRTADGKPGAVGGVPLNQVDDGRGGRAHGVPGGRGADRSRPPAQHTRDAGDRAVAGDNHAVARRDGTLVFRA